MNYKTLTEELSRILEINAEIFDFDLENEKLLKEDIRIKEYEVHKVNNHFIRNYAYKENIYEGWESISLTIPAALVKDFITILNPILKKHKRPEIDGENMPRQFDYVDEGLIFFLGTNSKTNLQLDIAKTRKKKV